MGRVRLGLMRPSFKHKSPVLVERATAAAYNSSSPKPLSRRPLFFLLPQSHQSRARVLAILARGRGRHGQLARAAAIPRGEIPSAPHLP